MQFCLGLLVIYANQTKGEVFSIFPSVWGIKTVVQRGMEWKLRPPLLSQHESSN